MQQMTHLTAWKRDAACAPRTSRFVGFGSFRSEWLLLPALLFLVAFYAYPVAKLLWTSIDGAALSPRHYLRFFQDSAYTYVLVRTLIVSVVVTFFCLVLGLPVAFLLARIEGRLRTVLLLLVLVPYLTSFLVRSYAWIVVLDDNGIVNSLLVGLGVTSKPIKLVYNWIGVYIGMIQIMLPFMILPLYNNILAIDWRIDRAAKSMGAGPFRRFVLVFLPLCASGIRSGCLLVFLLSLGFYITPAVLGGLSDVTLAMLIETQVTQLVNWGFAGAAAMILLIATFGTYLLLGRGVRLDAMFSGTSDRGANHFNQLTSSGSGEKPVHTRVLYSAVGMFDRTPLAGAMKPTAYAVATFVLLALFLPSALVTIMAFNSGDVLRFPPPGYSFRWFQNYLQTESWIDATLLSLRLAALTALFGTLLGMLAAFGVSRARGMVRAFTLSIMLSPLIVPPIVLGVALYQPLAQIGLIGTETAVVIGHLIGALPYVLIIVSAGLQSVDPSLQRAASSMGASAFRTFWKVTLPLIRPSIFVSALFAFIHSFDDLVITMMVGGIRVETLPLKMWSDIRNSIDPTIAAVSAILIGLVILWVALLALFGVGGLKRAD
ncbi:MAG: ABC transporter permease subunit [Hyphomicrobiaceae bacterium]